MTRNRMLRALDRLAIYACAYLLGWYGLNGETGAGNLYIGLVWLSFISTAIVFFHPALWRGVREKGASLPRGVAETLDVIQVIVLVYSGWWVTAFIIATGSFFTNIIFYAPLSPKK